MGVESILAPFMQQAEICRPGQPYVELTGPPAGAADLAKVALITARRPPLGAPSTSVPRRTSATQIRLLCRSWGPERMRIRQVRKWSILVEIRGDVSVLRHLNRALWLR